MLSDIYMSGLVKQEHYTVLIKPITCNGIKWTVGQMNLTRSELKKYLKKVKYDHVKITS